MWRMRPHCRIAPERAATRTWAAVDREGARPGTAAAMPVVPRKGAGGSVDQVEGDGRRARRGAHVSGLAQMEPCAQRLPRAAQACIRIARGATGQMPEGVGSLHSRRLDNSPLKSKTAPKDAVSPLMSSIRLSAGDVLQRNR